MPDSELEDMRALYKNSFIGCIINLSSSLRTIHLRNEAVGGAGITECVI